MREIHKLDINSEIIATDNKNPYLEYYCFPNRQIPICLDNKEPLNYQNIKKEIYRIFELYHPEWYKPQYFAIKENDLFEKVMQITNTRLVEIKYENWKNGFEHGKKVIKNLTWWKRLFNKF